MPEVHDPLVGQRLLDADGVTVGAVSSILINPDTRRGGWLMVELGGGTGPRLLPVSAASADGTGVLRVAWSLSAIAGSPAPPRGSAVVTDDLARRLLDHYGLDTL